MAVIHHTTLKPTKLELLAEWLPAQPWYEGDASGLRKAGGFRLDDPAGEVGIELMVVGSGEAAWLVPMTYRGAPLEGAEDGLIGTTEHGVLGARWIYDGMHDPVLVGQLFAFMRGEVPAHAQSVSDALDPSVHGELAGGGAEVIRGVVDGTEVSVAPGGLTLRVNRLLQAGEAPGGIRGHVAADWMPADEAKVRGVFFTVHA
jgi:hypothetical protein